MNPDLQKQVDELTKALTSLKDEFYRNNFQSSQDFQKYVRFNGRLKVPHHDSLPATCEIGELAETGGELNICSAVDTWTICGNQT